MNTARIFLVALFVSSGAAFAQVPSFRPVPTDLAREQSRPESTVRVQSSMNFFIPGLTNEGEEAQKLRERAKRVIYESAARECDLLRDTLAKDCRLESVNSNIDRQFAPQFNQQQLEGYRVNGQVSLIVTLK